MIYLKFSTGEKIPVKGTIKYQMVNDMFQDDLLMGDGTYPFSAVKTPELDKLMMYARIPSVNTFTSEFTSVELWDGDFKFRTGKLLAKEAGETYRFTFLADFGTVINELKNKSLKELDFGELVKYTTIPGSYGPAEFTKYVYNMMLGSWPTYRAVHFPIKNPGFFEGSDFKDLHTREYETESSPSASELLEEAQGIFNTYTPRPTYPSNIPYHHISALYCPAIYIHEILTVIFSNIGYKVDGGFMDDAELQTLVSQSLNVCNKGIVYDAQYNYIQGQYPEEIDLAEYMPDITVAEFLIAIKKTFRLSYSINRIEQKVKINLGKDIYTAPVVDWTNKLSSFGKRYPSDPDEIQYGYNLPGDDGYLARLIGDITSAFIQLLSSEDTVDYLPTSGNKIKDVRYVNQEEVYYIWTYNKDDRTIEEWQAFAHNVDAKNPDATRDYKNNACPIISKKVIYQDYEGDSGPLHVNHIKVPYMEHKGNCVHTHNDDGYAEFVGNPHGLKLLFYRGMAKDNSNTNQYPLATSDEKDGLGNSVGDYSLAWNGDNGLFATFHEKIDKLIREGDDFDVYFNLTRADLDNFVMYQRIKIQTTEFVVVDADIELPLLKPFKFYLKKLV